MRANESTTRNFRSFVGSQGSTIRWHSIALANTEKFRVAIHIGYSISSFDATERYDEKITVRNLWHPSELVRLYFVLIIPNKSHTFCPIDPPHWPSTGPPEAGTSLSEDGNTDFLEASVPPNQILMMLQVALAS